MQFLHGIRLKSPILGLCWLVLISLISSLPAHALPSQVDHVLPSDPVEFVKDRDLLPWDLLPRDLLRRDTPELEGWDLYQKYKKRKKNAPQESLPHGLTATAAKAERQDDLKSPGDQLYTFNERTVRVTSVVLGEGGDGTVYKGSLDGKPVAVKVSSSKELAQAGEFMVALKESQYVLEQLALFRGEDVKLGKSKNKREQMMFQVTPLQDENLASWLDNVSGRDWEQYHTPIAQQALQGLVDMHKQGIAHRDYKADNIFVEKKTGKMQAVVADLDRATKLVDTLAAGTGTQGYTPLEYMIGPSYDSKKSDVFAAAMTMMALLFFPQNAADPALGWTRHLWKAILDAQNPKWPNFRKESIAGRIKRKVLLHDNFADLLPNMTEELADVLSKAFCPQKERFTAQEFMDKFLPLLPFEGCS